MTQIHEPSSGSGSDLLAALNAELHDAHEALLIALAEMEAVTRDPAADRLRFSGARWRVSNASLARRTLWQRIRQKLAQCALGADARIVEELQQADAALLRASGEHVHTWTAAAVEARWGAYCLASREIRSKMKAAMVAEQRLLYPLLERYARATGARPRAA